jgi:hypothetical protein
MFKQKNNLKKFWNVLDTHCIQYEMILFVSNLAYQIDWKLDSNVNFNRPIRYRDSAIRIGRNTGIPYRGQPCTQQRQQEPTQNN